MHRVQRAGCQLLRRSLSAIRAIPGWNGFGVSQNFAQNSQRPSVVHKTEEIWSSRTWLVIKRWASAELCIGQLCVQVKEFDKKQRSRTGRSGEIKIGWKKWKIIEHLAAGEKLQCISLRDSDWLKLTQTSLAIGPLLNHRQCYLGLSVGLLADLACLISTGINCSLWAPFE